MLICQQTSGVIMEGYIQQMKVQKRYYKLFCVTVIIRLNLNRKLTTRGHA